jgi:hypothetical protein
MAKSGRLAISSRRAPAAPVCAPRTRILPQGACLPQGARPNVGLRVRVSSFGRDPATASWRTMARPQGAIGSPLRDRGPGFGALRTQPLIGETGSEPTTAQHSRPRRATTNPKRTLAKRKRGSHSASVAAARSWMSAGVGPFATRAPGSLHSADTLRPAARSAVQDRNRDVSALDDR